MARVTDEAENTNLMRQHNLRKQKNFGVSGAIEDNDLSLYENVIDWSQCHLFNAHDKFYIGREKGNVKPFIMPNQRDIALFSDPEDDELDNIREMLIQVHFQNATNVTAMRVRCDKAPNMKQECKSNKNSSDSKENKDKDKNDDDDEEYTVTKPNKIKLYRNKEGLTCADCRDTKCDFELSGKKMFEKTTLNMWNTNWLAIYLQYEQPPDDDDDDNECEFNSIYINRCALFGKLVQN